MGSSSRRTHGDEREQDMTIDKSTKMVAYPSSRSVYKSDDIRVALFLVETHDQKSPSSAVMGPRPVDIPDLRLPSDEEEEEEEEEFSWFGAFAGPPRQPRRKARQNAGEYLTARNVRLALKLIEKAKPDLLFTSTPPFYQPPGAVSIFGFYAVGCNVINTAYLEIRRGNCNNFVSYRRHSFSSSSSHRSLGLNSEWTKAELLLRERAKEVPMACREMGVWERQGDLAAAMSRDRIPDGLEWWGGGGNKDIDLDQGTREEKRNRVEIQYKVPPEATDGEYCSVVFAKFDQDWRSQSNPEPRLPPQTHLARLRLEKDYYAHSSEGDSFVVGHQLWLFPRFLPALYPTVYTLGYPLVVRGDNIEGFARLHFLLPVSKPPSAKSRGRSQTTSPSRPSLSRASSSLIPVEILLNWGGNLNEKRFRLDPYTGELRHRHGKPPPLSITRVDISIRLSRSSLELPRGRFLLKIYEGGDLFHHALSQIFSTAEGQIEDEEANEEEGKAMSREKDASILLLSGKISTGPEAADDSETGYNSLVKGKRRGMIRRRLKSQTNHMNVSTPEYTASFVRIDPYNVRGSADVSVTSLLGRTLRVEWQSDNDMEDHEEIKEEKTQQEEEKKKVGIPEEKEEEKVSEERVVGYAVIGGSLHTPRIEQYVREQVKPSLHLSGQQHIAKKEEIRIHQNSSNSSSISSSSSETPHGNQGEHSVSSYVTSLVCVFRDEEGRDPSSLSKKEGGTQKGGVVHEEEKGDGKNVRKKDEEMTPTPSVEEKNKKMTDSTIPSVMKLSPAVQAADTLLQEIAGYLRLTFAIEGEPKRLEDQTKGNASDKEHLKEKGDQEDGKESFLKGHAHMHAELCGIKMTTSPSRPLLTLKFHEDCCPPQVLVPVKSHRRVLKPSSRLLQSTTWRWFDVLLGGGKTSGKIKKETSTCWKLRPGSSPGLRNCRCGPGAVVTVSPSHASELGWTSSSASFSPFSSKTFFLPPTDIRDSQGNRHLSCSLGIVPPYPGHGGRLLHSQLEDRKTQGGIPRSLPPATPNPLPFLLKSLNPRDTSASASSLFLSRFVCGTPTQPSWREWRKVHPLMSTLNIREEKKNKKEDEEMKASEANHGVEGNPDENKNKAADRTKRETEKEQKRSRGGGGEEKEGSSASIGRSRIADIVAFLESANETSDDDDLTLDPRLYIALLLALIGGVCIVSPCIISLYNCYKHPRDCGRGVRSWCCYCCLDRHTAVHPHPISHDDTSTSDSGLFDVDEGQEEEEEAFYEQEKAHLSMGGGVHGHQIDPRFDRLSLKKQRSEATDHSKSTTTGSGTVAAAVMSTVVGAGTLSRGISGGTTSNADYEPFFAITGDDDVDEDEDHEGEGTEHINHHMFT
ncbi:zinc carboxypeptidase [Cystoisospora suis]|uniref:Zinc carboxypeptidase n=1 Tax=Cystoisospora suis TaxID=483139 RepID=A0A2C6LH07_9APIC|nr:zinc carboxypeptidase [Cystoisospora suis]